MNQAVLPRPSLWLRSLLGRPSAPEPQTCCVRGCASGPAIVVAARGSTTVWMCPAHARRWLDSAESFAAENDPRHDLRHLDRFARAASASDPAF